jgi:hypothetical protein
MALSSLVHMVAKLVLYVVEQPRPLPVSVLDDDASMHALDDSVLDHIFSFVGIGEYIYAAGVNKQWRERYTQLCNDKVVVKSYLGTDFVYTKLRTSHKSAIMTAARLQLALDTGLDVAAIQAVEDWWRVERHIVQHSLDPVGVLLLVKQHGCDWSDHLCSAAVSANKLELLQWLHSSGCPWDVDRLRSTAFRLDNLTLLKWLYSVTQPWSKRVLKEQLLIAGCDENLELAKWLREIGAPWPRRLYWDEGLGGGFWDPPMIAWALANGCKWGHWRCEDLLPEHWSGGGCGEQACDLLRYAHENGCPCTCDAETAAAIKTALAERQREIDT